MQQPLLTVRGLTKSYGNLLVLNNVDLTVQQGERVAIIGPSGGGKSTLLRCLNMLEDPTAGQVIFDGVDLADPKININEHRRKMGMVFQQFNLFDNLTVLQNIMLAPVKLRIAELRRTKWHNRMAPLYNKWLARNQAAANARVDRRKAQCTAKLQAMQAKLQPTVAQWEQTKHTKQVAGKTVVEYDAKLTKHCDRLRRQTEQYSQKLARLRYPQPMPIRNVDGQSAATIRKEEKEHAMQLLQRIDLVDKAGCYPSTLSGGQKQRIAIVRALAMHPVMMLFDEPTSALDPEMVGEVLALIKQVADEGMTMIIVTHEMAFARQIATRVLFVAEGHIAEQNTPDALFDNPQTPRLQEFLSKVL